MEMRFGAINKSRRTDARYHHRCARERSDRLTSAIVSTTTQPSIAADSIAFSKPQAELVSALSLSLSKPFLTNNLDSDDGEQAWAVIDGIAFAVRTSRKNKSAECGYEIQ